MTVRLIRTLRDGTAHYTQSVTLDGRLYVMALDYNARDSFWYLSLSDADGVAIQGCVGRRLVANYPILRSVDARRPPGELLMGGGELVPAGLTTIGQGQRLYYADAAELGRAIDHFGAG